MNNQITVKPNFKGELSHIEVLGLITYIQKWHDENYVLNSVDVENKFGLAPTSTSEFARLWDTNYNGTLEDYGDLKVQSFALTVGHVPVLIMEDDEENELYFEI
jgi:hypothetical protein